MSLLDELTNRGLTAEDLEKAASVRLFEQDCAAENINLNEMADDDIEELYAHWLTLGEGEGEKAAESDEPTQEEVDEATAKLAEAEYLGRHMARAFNDEAQKLASTESEKEAGMKERGASALSSLRKAGKRYGELMTGGRYQHPSHGFGKGSANRKELGKAVGTMAGTATAVGGGIAALKKGKKPSGEKDASAKETVLKHLKSVGSKAKGHWENAALSAGTNPGKTLAAGGVAGAATFGAGRASKGEKKASFDALVEQYATEILAENGVELETEESTPTIDEIAYARAVEILEENGYSFEE